MTRYRTIVADPPWEYDDGFANNPKPGTRGWKPLPYPSMTVWQIAALPVRSMAEKDCRLFLWTTNRYLRSAFMVLDAWEFKYAQTLVWHRGTPPTVERLSTSVIAANVQDHSAKPEAFLDLVETVSPGPFLELFSRRARFGWDVWGNESLGTVELAS